MDQEMLEYLGISRVEELFSDIPDEVRIRRLNLPNGISEMEVIAKIRSLLSANITAEDFVSFLGGGVYDHFIPSAVAAIAGRAEFVTSYTPYQAEISQGMLQSLFEYQSMIAELTGLEAVNSSNYDASTALGEAAAMCHRINGHDRFLVPRAMSWEKKSVLANHLRGPKMEMIEYGYDPSTGKMDLGDLTGKVGRDTCGLYVEVPNFLGVIDTTVMELKEELADVPLVVGVNPLSLAVLRPPGDWGADIVVGEGQVLGSPINFGGPLLGIFATRQQHIRKMPGRVIGLTRDEDGRRAFCMTLQTREQHIRRSRATSNICTNEALMAVAAAAYMAILGGEGLRELAEYNIAHARELMEGIASLDGYDIPFLDQPHFNEFALRTPIPPSELNRRLLDEGIIGGLPLERHLPELKDAMLLATTEMRSDEDHQMLISALREVR